MCRKSRFKGKNDSWVSKATYFGNQYMLRETDNSHPLPNFSNTLADVDSSSEDDQLDIILFELYGVIKTPSLARGASILFSTTESPTRIPLPR
jgi:hypothetical protein